MVTYSFIDNGTPGSTEFPTLTAAFAQATADYNAGKTMVSVDDHEGNFYDAEALLRMVTPPGDG